MNAATPTPFDFGFKGFCRRGGGTDIHKDGWGLSLYEGRGLRSFLDVRACAKSPVARFIQSYPTSSQNVIAHIRCATHGRVGLENVHPFSRELWGIPWCFAHNGNFPSFAHQNARYHMRLRESDPLVYHAIGDTDSEAFFCALLNALRAEFDTLPTLQDLYKAILTLMDDLIRNDETMICNFLLGCGPHKLFCYSCPGHQDGSNVWNGLFYILREPPMSGTARLTDAEFSIHFDIATESERIAMIATKPLTNESGWIEMKRGELLLFNDGSPYSKLSDIEALEKAGRGLVSRCFLKAH